MLSVMETHNRASYDKLAIVQTGSVELDKNLIRLKVRLFWDVYVLEFERFLETILAVQNPLARHFVVLSRTSVSVMIAACTDAFELEWNNS